MLHKDIQKEIAEAMREKNTDKLNAVRGLMSAVTNELVSSGRKPQEKLEDEKVQEVVRRQMKQRKDSIAQYREGGRNDLAEAEERELSYLKNFAPPEMSEAEIREAVRRKKEELGVSEKKDMGTLMGAVMKELKGKADGENVRRAVERELS